jgi:hypothetical protein
LGLCEGDGQAPVRLKGTTAVVLCMSLLLASCGGASDGLKAPGTIQPSTSGEVCKAVREGLKTNAASSVIAVGSCEEQKTLNGGRSLWIEMNDFAAAASEVSADTLKYLLVSVAVGLAAYGFRKTKEDPTDYEQLFFSFRDARGTFFEIQPSDMVRFLPEDSATQDEWDALVDSEVKALLPSIEISYTQEG